MITGAYVRIYNIPELNSTPSDALLHGHVLFPRSRRASLHGIDNLSPNLRTDRDVWPDPNDIQQRVFLIGRQVTAVSLDEDEQTLMPEHGQLVLSRLGSGRVGKSDKVENQRVDDLVWQSVFLVEENTDKQRVGTGIVHTGQSE